MAVVVFQECVFEELPVSSYCTRREGDEIWTITAELCVFWVSHVKHTKCWQKASHSGVMLNAERKEEERGVGREGKVERMREGGRGRGSKSWRDDGEWWVTLDCSVFSQWVVHVLNMYKCATCSGTGLQLIEVDPFLIAGAIHVHAHLIPHHVDQVAYTATQQSICASHAQTHTHTHKYTHSTHHMPDDSSPLNQTPTLCPRWRG